MKKKIWKLRVNGIVSVTGTRVNVYQSCKRGSSNGWLILGETITGVASDKSKAKSTEILNSSLKLSGFVNIDQIIYFS